MPACFTGRRTKGRWTKTLDATVSEPEVLRLYDCRHRDGGTDTALDTGVWYHPVCSENRAARAGPLLNDVRGELGMARLYIPRDKNVMERLIAKRNSTERLVRALLVLRRRTVGTPHRRAGSLKKGKPMKQLFVAALLAASFADIGVVSAQSPADSSQNTLCWDVLNHVARDKNQAAGRVQATGNNAQMYSGSSEERKVQGPGAEPKDAAGVTTGESNSGQRKRDGASLRPPGLPNC